MLMMFVYGTLKRGGRNHERYCGGALRVEEAWVRGELYDLPLFHFPALVVSEASIHAFGTANYAGDAEKQRNLSRERLAPLEGPRVFGEVFYFDDPASRLAAIDGLEGFDPADASSHYRRVLLPAQKADGSTLLAWAYVVEKSSGVYLPKGVWPP
jgi:gamma-glutamylcyclotransferase (GGCT)/AIG2-like uncharacterized protein YtfP